MISTRKDLRAYVAPFALFMLGLVAVSGAKALGLTTFAGIPLDPMYWIYPIQTIVCAVALLWFWRSYDFGESSATKLGVGLAVGLLVFGLWIAPQELFHQSRRLEGFDPEAVPGMSNWMLAARFARLVIVVPLVEEIFWRGFLLRYLVREDFKAIPFGSCNRFSFWAVVVAFTAVHAPSDWPAAFLTGILFNLVAVRTESLTACVLAHAAANLALGVYICATRQWGFW
ncbi:MAG: CAAX prenyl protease-related protein [Verrucomicrobia bacterium]|nr:MAG: CAAX prenyl protease-related protein [Verrucomicrobiota bacterium]